MSDADPMLQEAVNALAQYGSKAEAARMLGVPVTTLKHRLDRAQQEGVTPNNSEAILLELKDQIRTLKAQLGEIHQDNLSTKQIRETMMFSNKFNPFGFTNRKKCNFFYVTLCRFVIIYCTPN